MSDPEVEFNGDMGHLIRLILIYLIRSLRVCRRTGVSCKRTGTPIVCGCVIVP